MSKKLITILIAVFSVIIAVETFYILSDFSQKDSENTVNAGTVTYSDTIVTINDIQIPSYDFQSAIYIAAEDLNDFGFEIIRNTDDSISLNYSSEKAMHSENVLSGKYSDIPDNSKLHFYNHPVTLNGTNIQCYTTYDYHLIPAKSLKRIISLVEEDKLYAFNTTIAPENILAITSQGTSTAASEQGKESRQANRIIEGSNNARIYRSPANNTSKIIVLDPGHGKSSSSMSKEEKLSEGYSYNESKGQWGEWRHWKSGTSSVQCEGSGCSKTHPANGGCWYPIGNGDRATEPELNLNNALAAKKYLEQMGYTVRMTRTSNDENPSFSKRLSYCYPNNDNTQQADALLYMCIHSNAGGGSGTAYISASGPYDQKGIRSTYINDCNTLGGIVNEKIVASTSLKKSGNGSIGGLGALIAFCKSPVTCGYMEIGFYDKASDLAILKSESDAIGKAIAEGIDEFVKNY